MIRLPIFDPKQTFDSWKQILHVGIPAAGTNMMEPLSMAVITRMISEYGKEAVAAFGVGGRLEALSLIGIWALSMAMTPFVGQNFGAGNSDRIRAALRFGVRFSLVWGGVVFTVLYLLSGIIAPIFNDNKAVIASVILFFTNYPDQLCDVWDLYAGQFNLQRLGKAVASIAGHHTTSLRFRFTVGVSGVKGIRD